MGKRFLVSGNLTPSRQRIAEFIRDRGYVIIPHPTFVAFQRKDGPITWMFHTSWAKLVRIKHLDAWLSRLEDKAVLEMREAYEVYQRRTVR